MGVGRVGGEIVVVVEGDMGYNGAKPGIMLREGRKTLLTAEVEARRALEDRVKGKSICGRVVVLGVVMVCLFGLAGGGYCGVATVNYRISASADDDYASTSSSHCPGCSFLEIGTGGTDFVVPFPISGLRFRNIEVGRGMPIVGAVLDICGGTNFTHGKVYGVIQAEASDNGADFSSRNIADANKTTASVEWDHLQDWGNNTWHISPDISGVVQEVVDRPGWSFGNSMVIIYGTRAKSSFHRQYSAWDRGSGYAPLLSITYEFYNISGHITGAEGGGVSGVTVSGGGGLAPAITDANGYYELQVPPGWSGTVTPSIDDWGFNPASRSYSNVAGDQVNQDYTTFQPKISGYVSDANGLGVGGVTVSTIHGGGSDISDANGYYEIVVPYDWSGAVWPEKTGLAFEPQSRWYSKVTEHQTAQGFDAAPAPEEDIILESARLGPTDHNMGWGVSASQFLGVRFMLRNKAKVTAVGGHITEWGGGDFFAAIVRLSGEGARPQGSPFTASEVVASGVFDPGFPSSDYRMPFSVVLDWGYYAFVFGTDEFGASGGQGGMPFEGQRPRGYGYEYILWNGSGWYNTDPWPPPRFVIEGIDRVSISGRVTTSDGVGLEGVNLYENGGVMTWTDSEGYYSRKRLYDWSGTVTPRLDGWGFAPDSRTYSNLISDQNGQDYVAFQPKISGHVRDSNGIGVEGVLVSADNGGSSYTTGANGYYEVTVVYDWSGTVTASKSWWVLSPESRIYDNVVADQSGQDYTGFGPPIISGYVIDPNGAAEEGILISADNGGTTDTTDVNGYYEVMVLHGWSGTVSPNDIGWDYLPESYVYTDLTVDTPNQNFIGIGVMISGHMKRPDGIGTEGVLLSADNMGGSDTTDANGYYELAAAHHWSGRVTVSKPDWAFSPESRDYNDLTEDQVGQDYMVTAMTATYEISDDLDDGDASSSGSQDLGGFLRVGRWTGGPYPPYCMIGLRFRDVEIAKYSHVTDAKVRLVFARSPNYFHVYVQGVLQGEASDDAEVFSGSNRLGNRPRTTASVNWDMTSVWQVGRWYTSPDISGVVQDVIDRPGWTGGNSMVIFWCTRTNTSGVGEFLSHDYNSTYPDCEPKLEVRFEFETTYIISGHVRDSNGLGVEGALVSGNNVVGWDTTDVNGYYELPVPEGWSGTVTASKDEWGIAFVPSSRSYQNITADHLDEDYTLYQPPKISGHAVDMNGVGVAGVDVSADNGGGSDTTDANGYYAVAVPYGWSGTVRLSIAGFDFYPRNRQYSDVISDQVGQDYSLWRPWAGKSLAHQVSAGTDDGLTSETAQWLYLQFLYVGHYCYYDSSMKLVCWDAPYPIAGLRFRDVHIPKGAVIADARLSVKSYSYQEIGWGCMNSVIQAEDSDDPPDFSVIHIDERPKTTTGVNWDLCDQSGPYGVMPLNKWYKSPNIASVIQEVVNRSGWAYGNSVAILWSPRSNSSSFCAFHSYEKSSYNAAKLEITLGTYTISGRVAEADGSGVGGVVLTAEDTNEAAVTDSNGYYALEVPALHSGWWGAVSASKWGWAFVPESSFYGSVTADEPNQDYLGLAPPVISGYVRDSNGIGAGSVVVSADNGGRSGVTDWDGYYELRVPYNWSGTITPSRTGWVFAPESHSYANLTEDRTNQNFTFTGIKVSGRVTSATGTAIEGVHVSADNGGGFDITDMNGFYELPVAYDWSGGVTASRACRTFEPVMRSYSNLRDHQANQDFVSLEILRVQSDGGGGCNTIQAAIDAAVDGDEVVVEPGLYTGQGNSNIDFKGKAITVRGTEPDDVNVVAATIVEPNVGNYESYRGFYFHSGEGPDSVLDGVTISGRNSWVRGVTCYQSSPTIRNCIIEDCLGIGIDLWDSNGVIENCLVDGCGGYSEMGGGAISCWGGASVTISNCVVRNGPASEWYGTEGISCGENDAIISNCTIIDNNGIGMYLRSGDIMVTDCTISGNKNRVGGDGGGGIWCYLGDVTITNCTVSDNGDPTGRGIGGIGGSGAGSLTISDCIISNNHCSYDGGGIYWPEGNVVISDCTIKGNTAEGSGGGVWGGDGTISRCDIMDNTAGGDGGGLSEWDGEISDCNISGNWAGYDGGGLSRCDGTISYSTIAKNRCSGKGGGGLFSCAGTISNCEISGNISQRHGGGLLVCNGPITNCMITGNKATDGVGGGLAACDSIGNCTIAGNTGAEGGGLIDCRAISNSIIRNNFADVNSQLSDSVNPAFSCIEGWTGGGEGNIDVDPCFVEAGYWVDVNDANIVVEPNDPNGVWVEGDYHLLAGSLCIDAGDPNYSPEPNETDIDGEPRVMGGRVDIGADEVGLYLDFGLDNLWMYQNLPGQSNSDLTAGVSVTDDPMGNSSYSYAWEIVLPGDVSLAPVTVDGGGASDTYWTFAARGCDEPGGLSDSGQVFTVRVTITGDDYGNTGQAEGQFGIALLGDTNNDGVVNVADRSIANAFWRTGSAGPYTLRDCDVNCDGVVNVADRSIANAIWRGILGQNSVSTPCPLR